MKTKIFILRSIEMSPRLLNILSYKEIYLFSTLRSSCLYLLLEVVDPKGCPRPCPKALMAEGIYPHWLEIPDICRTKCFSRALTVLHRLFSCIISLFLQCMTFQPMDDLHTVSRVLSFINLHMLLSEPRIPAQPFYM